MKFLGNGVVFAVLYIVFMIPTYLLPYVGSNSALVNAGGALAEQGLSPQSIAHVLCLGILILVTFFRGQYVGKVWLVILPILASVFDLAPGLSLIPFVPTVLHLFVLVKGVSDSPPQAS